MIVALAGRRIDELGSAERRFPVENIEPVKDELRSFFKNAKADSLVGSGACGADLIGMEAAGEIGMHRVMIIPFAPDLFKHKSVVDRPGAWGHLFDNIVKDISQDGELVILDKPGKDADLYQHTNIEILDRALKLSGSPAKKQSNNNNVVAVVVWNGVSRGKDDMCSHFIKEAEKRMINVVVINTLGGASRHQH